MRSLAQPRSKTPLAILAGTVLLVAAPFGLMVAPVGATAEDKVGVCHRTASETNPYVYIEVPEEEANGHITGTSLQHNHKVTWPEDGTWRGVPHEAGDERLDYFASGPAECTDTTETATTTATTTTATTTTATTTTATTTTTAATETTTATTTATATVTETEETEVLGEQTQTPKAQEEQTPKAQEQAPQVLGEQASQPDVEANAAAAAPEVMGAQASVPSSVAAGAEASPIGATAADTRLWWAAVSGLLAVLIGLGLATTSHARLGFAGRHLPKGR